MAGELPNRFGRLCLRALAEGAISESKAAGGDIYVRSGPGTVRLDGGMR